MTSAVANDQTTRIDISGLSAGLYLVNLRMDNGSTMTRKLIVN